MIALLTACLFFKILVHVLICISKTKGEGLLLAKVTRQSILNWITILDWFLEQRSQGKSFVFSFKTMKCLEQLISVRSCCNVYTNRGNDRLWLASFSCCQKRSNNWALASLLSFTIFYRNCCYQINSAAESDGVMQWCGLQSLTGLRRSFKTCGNSNTLDGSQDDAIYDNKMPEVADDDSRLTAKRTTMTNWKIVWSFHKQNGSFRRQHLNKSHCKVGNLCLLIITRLIAE